MTDKRLVLALLPLVLLAGCDREPAEEGAATGEVLEGTVSDAMLPLDRVRSEPPLEDPEAFADAQSEAADAASADARPAAEADVAPSAAEDSEAGEAAAESAD